MVRAEVDGGAPLDSSKSINDTSWRTVDVSAGLADEAACSVITAAASKSPLRVRLYLSRVVLIMSFNSNNLTTASVSSLSSSTIL